MSTGAMLAPLAVFFLLASSAGAQTEPEWWETTLIYQIWPRAFQDSDGDGSGDLQGIVDRLDYLQDLGVETICLNPIYPSPMIAAGYDISNYTDIHPIFGDMDDFDQLIYDVHDRGMKVILDIVPNHSSSEHTWFYGSINRIDPYTDYYIWADGEVDGNGTRQPPNDWVNVLSYDDGSAWTWNEVRGQWYYHKFHESQPDLNLRNEDVIQEILDVIDFWLNKGVDGFTISDVHYFFENPNLNEDTSLDETIYTSETPETSNLLQRIREYTDNWSDVNNSTGKLLIAEAWAPDANLVAYYGNDDYSGVVPLNFRLIGSIEEDVNAGDIKFLIDGWLKMLPENATTNWPLSTDNHPRVATRVGDDKVDSYLILAMLLPGQAYTYYGDEIGMTDSKIPWNDTVSPVSPLLTPNTLVEYSRDAPRTPMQWNEANSAGFSTNDTTYLPVNENYEYKNVERQLDEPGSTLNTYKTLAKLRKDPVFQKGDWDVETLNDDKVLLLKRSLEGHPDYVILLNTGSERESVNISTVYPELQDHLKVVISAGDPFNQTAVLRDNVKLMPDAAMVLKSTYNDTTVDSLINDTNTEDFNFNFGLYEDTYGAPMNPDVSDIINGYLSSEINEEPPFDMNNSSEVDEKIDANQKPINFTTVAMRVPTTQAPRSMNNEVGGDAAESSAYNGNKMVKLVLGLCCTVAAIFNNI